MLTCLRCDGQSYVAFMPGKYCAARTCTFAAWPLPKERDEEIYVESCRDANSHDTLSCRSEVPDFEGVLVVGILSAAVRR